MQRVPVVSKKCWRCNYRDFEILAFVSHTASGDFSQICPECPDYSSLLLVYDARVKDSVIVSFGKIVLTGKAATEPQNWRFWYNFHGEQIHLQRSVGPNGENANVFWFSNTTPGAYTVHYSNINYPYCIYELEINVIGVGCADSDILISRFIAPNSFIIEDASGCDVEIFTVNGEDLTTSIQRNGNRWTIPGRNWTGLDVTVSYSNDCGCSKTRVFYSAVSLSEDCFTETLNEKMKSFFSAFGKALESNFASTGSISLSPFHQNYHESLLNFFVENCNEACKSFVEYPSQVPPNINFSEFFGWVFDCGYEISYTKHIENHPAPANLNFQSYWDLITLHSLTVVVSSPLSPQNKYFYGFVASRLRRRADGAIFVAYDHRLHRVQGNHLYYSPTLDFFTTNPEDAYRQSNFSSLHSIEPLELFV
ncbi:MAG: hypothetical protein RMM53_09900 [Bacteroidia bacterium]|nr:hypothetical protein [Bacteroidia bacterium]